MSRSPSPTLVTLFAVGAGLSVAGLYYNQPMLGTLAVSLGASSGRIGAIPVATLLGYAGGIVLFGPLGDKVDRRKVIVVRASLLSIALVLAGLAPGVLWLSAASLAVGLLATVAQD